MSVRNCREIGENLQKIISRLMANNRLVNLLYYEDKDPLAGVPLSEKEKKELVFNKLIKVTPNVSSRKDEKSTVVVVVSEGTRIIDNREFRSVFLTIDSIVPLTAWMIKDSNLRPFAIMGEIQDSLEGKVVNGLGRIEGGDFTLNYVTEEVSSYRQNFVITIYE